MRINARLDEEWADKLAYLRAKTGARTTDIVKCSIDLYYRQVHQSQMTARQALDKSGFVGCGSGQPGLSRNYKELLRQGLDEKTGRRREPSRSAS